MRRRLSKNGLKKDKRMTSRKEILERIRKLDLERVPLPDIDIQAFEPDIDDLKGEFMKMATSVGVSCVDDLKPISFFEQWTTLFPNATSLITSCKDFEKYNTFPLDTMENQSELEDLDLFVVRASFGVAENGSVWIPEKDLPIRVLPFICKHLVILLDPGQIVSTMHKAYHNLESRDDGFGVFISGPSKTADIEQSLVIGAQGALSVHLLFD